MFKCPFMIVVKVQYVSFYKENILFINLHRYHNWSTLLSGRGGGERDEAAEQLGQLHLQHGGGPPGQRHRETRAGPRHRLHTPRHLPQVGNTQHNLVSYLFVYESNL